MKRFLTMTFAAAASLALASATYGQGASFPWFTAALDGEQEAPTPVDTPSSGQFLLRFSSDRTEATFTLQVLEGIRVTQAHIHCAPTGQAGSIVAWLAGFHELGWDVDGLWVSNTMLTDENIIPTTPQQNPTCPDTITTLSELEQAMRNGNTYVNVHTVANPAGEIRGQITPVTFSIPQ